MGKSRVSEIITIINNFCIPSISQTPFGSSKS
jgi:hypothetical protein